MIEKSMITKAFVWLLTLAQDGYVSDSPWRYVFVDAQDIFEWRIWKLLQSSLINQDTTSALIGQKAFVDCTHKSMENWSLCY